jgi:hypothetical protein
MPRVFCASRHARTSVFGRAVKADIAVGFSALTRMKVIDLSERYGKTSGISVDFADRSTEERNLLNEHRLHPRARITYESACAWRHLRLKKRTEEECVLHFVRFRPPLRCLVW